MKTYVTKHTFIDTFLSSNTYKDNFSYDGLCALFDFLEQREEELGEEIEFDIVAFCCDFSEYKSATEAASNYFSFEGMTYGEEGEELETPEQVEAKALEYLHEHTNLIEFDGGIIICNF